MLGRCVIERRLRRDRLASVYLARGPEPGEVFSVWSAHNAVVARSERAVLAFGLEVERLQHLDHPGLPRIVAYDATDGAPSVVYERRPGSGKRQL